MTWGSVVCNEHEIRTLHMERNDGSFLSPRAGSAHSLYCSGVQYGASPEDRETENPTIIIVLLITQFLNSNDRSDVYLQPFTIVMLITNN